MSARIALPTLVLAVLTAPMLVHPAAAGPWGLAPGEWYVNLEGSTFTANTFHLASGARADTGLVVETRALRLYSERGLTEGVTLIFGLPVMSVTRRDAWVQGTATGFQDVLLGGRWKVGSGSTALALGFDWSGPAGYNRNLDTLGFNLGEGVPFRDSVRVDLGAGRDHRDFLEHSGDGLQELGANLHFGSALAGRGFFQASLGYSYRFLSLGQRKKNIADLYDFLPQNYVVPRVGLPDTTIVGRRVTATHIGRGLWADRVNASADLGLWIGSSLMVSGRYRGLLTVANGPLLPRVTRHLAGPLVLYRVDDRLDMFAGSWSTASGKNTLHFDQIYLGLAFHHTKLNRLQGFLGGAQAP